MSGIARVRVVEDLGVGVDIEEREELKSESEVGEVSCDLPSFTDVNN